MTHAPSTYKIPTANDCPAVFRVRLFENDNVRDSIHHPARRWASHHCCCPSRCSSRSRDAVSAVGATASDPPLAAPATGKRSCARWAVRRPAKPMKCAAQSRRCLARPGGRRARPKWRSPRLGAARDRRAHAGERHALRGHHRRRASGAEGDRACAADAVRSSEFDPRARSPSVRAFQGQPRALRQCSGRTAAVHYPLGPARPVLRRRGDAPSLASTPGARRLAAGRAALSSAALAPAMGRAIVRPLAPLNVRVDWIDERDDQFPPAAEIPAHARVVAVDAPEAEVDVAPKARSSWC